MRVRTSIGPITGNSRCPYAPRVRGNNFHSAISPNRHDLHGLDYFLTHESISLSNSRPLSLPLLSIPCLTLHPISSLPGSRAPCLLPIVQISARTIIRTNIVFVGARYKHVNIGLKRYIPKTLLCDNKRKVTRTRWNPGHEPY